MRKEYTFHSKEEKLKIVERYLSGESLNRYENMQKQLDMSKTR